MIPSIYATFKPGQYEFDGLPVKAPAPYLILCAKRGIGIILPAALMRPRKPEHVRWMPPDSVMSLAGIDRAELTRRIKNGWSGWDILKPHGWQRVVDARRDGITWNGETHDIKHWARRLGLTLPGFVRRLADLNQGMDEVMRPAPKRGRIFTERAPTGVTGEPIISPSGGIRGHFFFRGAVDTLAGHCQHAGISFDTVRYRLRRKDKHGNMMTLEQAMDIPAGSLRRSDRGVKNRKRGVPNDPLVGKEWYPDDITPSFPRNTPQVIAARERADAAFEAAGGQAAVDAAFAGFDNWANEVSSKFEAEKAQRAADAEREAALAKLRAEAPAPLTLDELLPKPEEASRAQPEGADPGVMSNEEFQRIFGSPR